MKISILASLALAAVLSSPVKAGDASVVYDLRHLRC